MGRFTVIKTTFINGQTYEAGSEVELDEANAEYVEMLLADGNVARGTAARRTDVPEDSAESEATATEAPLEPTIADLELQSKIEQDVQLENSNSGNVNIQ